MLEAERAFQQAIEADGNSAAAHLGLAEVRDRSGDITNARLEAEQAVRVSPTAAGYILLAQIALQTGNLSASATDVGFALKLEPANAAAQQMRTMLAAKGQALP